MNRRSICLIGLSVAAATILVAYGITKNANSQPASPAPVASPVLSAEFPEGTATPSEQCGACHKLIYREFAEGFGSDTHWAGMMTNQSSNASLALPKGTPPSATAHALAGIDPWPLDAMQVEENGRQCNVCHYPQPLEYPDIAALKIERPTPRLANRERGITCASCHLTPDGKIRGPYGVQAPHATIKDERIKTSVACAFCHSDGERVVGKQTQTFLEWREDFNKAGLGPQHCQDCHMPKTVRKLAEDFPVPERVVARHLQNGGHSFQRISAALTLAVGQPEEGKSKLAFQITNVGAGHSVPTGSNRRAIYLVAEIKDANQRVVATKEWMFAPWFASRPDDLAFVEEDKKGPQPIAAIQADMQGPHETIIRAGEQRTLDWTPEVLDGVYSVQARLIYDLNRYNARSFKEDQSEIAHVVLDIMVAKR
jgi:nitrate/TMAO reductase-like tetraheme cytochrome c subunit